MADQGMQDRLPRMRQILRFASHPSLIGTNNMPKHHHLSAFLGVLDQQMPTQMEHPESHRRDPDEEAFPALWAADQREYLREWTEMYHWTLSSLPLWFPHSVMLQSDDMFHQRLHNANVLSQVIIQERPPRPNEPMVYPDSRRGDVRFVKKAVDLGICLFGSQRGRSAAARVIARVVLDWNRLGRPH